MKRITNESCVLFVKDEYIGRIIRAVVLCAIAVLMVRLIVKVAEAVIVAAVLFPLLSVAYILRMIHKIRHLTAKDFYLEEDELIRFKKRLSLQRSGSGFRYIYTFAKHGKYTIHRSFYPTIEIPLHKGDRARHSFVEGLAMQSCDEGDRFYLLICEEHNRKHVIQCFPMRYFGIMSKDFECVDGKYIPKCI